MIDPAQRQHYLVDATALVSDRGRAQASSNPTGSQSFGAALSDELAKRSGLARENEALPADFALGQQNVARLNSAATSGLMAPATSIPIPPSSGLNVLAGTAPTGPPSGESFDQSYWASQPAAVQQLQNIQDPNARANLASQLAGEGYSIDVPIMVWGWDPAITTQARESMGYTWVPSALQQPVEVAPGLTFNGASYNPNNPPAGSITV